jgi:hypothetical protein
MMQLSIAHNTTTIRKQQKEHRIDNTDEPNIYNQSEHQYYTNTSRDTNTEDNFNITEHRDLVIILDIVLDPIPYRARINTINRRLKIDRDIVLDIPLGISPNKHTCSRLDQSTSPRSCRAGQGNIKETNTIKHYNKHATR